MKMSDVFDGDVVDINLFQDSCYIDTDEADYEIEDSEVKDRVIHAINNHDRMTDEIAELREALNSISMVAQSTPELNDNYGVLSDRIGEVFGIVETEISKHK